MLWARRARLQSEQPEQLEYLDHNLLLSGCASVEIDTAIGLQAPLVELQVELSI
jgi:hypothetical protein